MINKIENLKISELKDTKFIHPIRVTFEQMVKTKVGKQ